jgi:hypothetical protein
MLERGSLGASSVPLVGEEFRELTRVHNVVIEEIVSSATPDRVEYRQPGRGPRGHREARRR